LSPLWEAIDLAREFQHQKPAPQTVIERTSPMTSRQRWWTTTGNGEPR